MRSLVSLYWKGWIGDGLYRGGGGAITGIFLFSSAVGGEGALISGGGGLLPAFFGVAF